VLGLYDEWEGPQPKIKKNFARKGEKAEYGRGVSHGGQGRDAVDRSPTVDHTKKKTYALRERKTCGGKGTGSAILGKGCGERKENDCGKK